MKTGDVEFFNLRIGRELFGVECTAIAEKYYYRKTRPHVVQKFEMCIKNFLSEMLNINRDMRSRFFRGLVVSFDEKTIQAEKEEFAVFEKILPILMVMEAHMWN